MTPDEALASYRRDLANVGEDVIVRRYSGTGAARAVSASATTKARPVGYEPNELVGNVKQGDVKLIVLADALTSLLPLRDTDVIYFRNKERSIEFVNDNTRRIAGTLIALEIQVRG